MLIYIRVKSVIIIKIYININTIALSFTFILRQNRVIKARFNKTMSKVIKKKDKRKRRQM